MFRKLKLLIILAGCCAACGTIPESTAPAGAVTAVESAVALDGSMTMTGQYACAGVTYLIEQPISQTQSRRCCGLSNVYNTKIGQSGLPSGTNWSGYTKVQLLCNNITIPVSPVCGSGGALCATARVNCAMYNKPNGASSWTYSGTVETGCMLYPDYAAHGLYQMDLWYQGGGNGVGISACSSGFGANLYYLFGG